MVRQDRHSPNVADTEEDSDGEEVVDIESTAEDKEEDKTSNMKIVSLLFYRAF